MKAQDGKMRETDVADVETILRLAQSELIKSRTNNLRFKGILNEESV